MRIFRVSIQTNVVGSKCEDMVELPHDVTDAEIEDACREAAFNWIEWSYKEVTESKDQE